MLGAAAFVDMLSLYGVRFFFFMSGGPTSIFSEMSERAPKIRQVLTHGEESAAYMADGYSRASYRPGLCFGQVGPGAANLAAGIAEPFLASSPVIAVTGMRPADALNRNAYQELEQMRCFDPVTKWNVAIGNPSRIADLVRTAFRVATSGRPRPVHLSIPADVAAAEVDFPDPVAATEFSEFPPIRILPDPRKVAEALTLLAMSERPVLVAGGGAIASKAWGAVQKFAEKLAIPVATTLSGKGSIAEDHPLSIGVPGRYGRKSASEILMQSDVVLYIGCKVGSISSSSWTILAKGAKIIQVDIDAAQLGWNYPVTLGIVADARLALEAMIRAARTKNTGVEKRKRWVAAVKVAVSEWRKEATRLSASEAVPVSVHRVIGDLRAVLRDGALVSDTGYAAAWSGVLFDVLKPGRSFYRSAGSLGWAFPASIGVKLALPDKQVVCFTGDGGFGYHLTELETASRIGAAVVTVVVNNSTLAFERHDFQYFLGGKGYEASDYAPTNFAKIAQAFGCHGVRVERPGEIRDALSESLRAGKPAVVDIVTNPDEIAPVTDYEKYVPRIV
jgi:acetolactate synthase-1/2/3 large subunit